MSNSNNPIGFLINILIVLLLVILIVLVRYNKASIDSYSNMEEIYRDGNNKVIRATRKELKSIIMINDSIVRQLMDSVNIKPKNVRSIVNNKYVYNYDTVIVMKVIKDSVKTKVLEYKPDSCVTLKAKIVGDTIFIDTLLVDYNTTNIYYKIRIGSKGRRTFFPFGRIKYGVISTNNCNGETNVEEIKIERR